METAKDRMMQARGPAPEAAHDPMQMIAQLTPEVVDAMDETQAKTVLNEIVMAIGGGSDQENAGEQWQEPQVPGQPPM